MSTNSQSEDKGPDSGERIAQWRRATGMENDRVFELRLQAEWMTAEELADRIACLEPERYQLEDHITIPPVTSAHRDLPDIDQWRAVRARPIPWSPAEEALAPFLRVVARPWLEAREARIWRMLKALDARYPGALDRDSVFHSARHALQTSVLHWVAPAAVLELNLARARNELSGICARSRFRGFLDHLGSTAGRRDFLSAYPGIARSIECRTEQAGAFFIRILWHFTRDRAALRETLPGRGLSAPLSRIVPGRGDRHDGGRSVSMLEFAGGGRLVYKPRALEMEAAYADLVRWMRDQGIEPVQRAAEVARCGDHGYMEYVPYEAVTHEEEAESFCFRLGGLVAVVYLLSGTDMHYENLIACGAHPVLIDLETLFHPMVPVGAVRGPDNDSVLSARMLPVWTDRNAGRGMEVCALAAWPGSVEARVPAHAGTDRLTYRKSRVLLPGWHNLPLLGGRPVLPTDYPSAFIRGFESAYRGLMRTRTVFGEPGGPLRRFRGLNARAILRGTEVYNSLMNAFAHPDVQSSEVARERLLERLWLKVEKNPGMTDAVREERCALRRYDVPRFRIRTDETVVRDSEDRPLCHTFEKSGYEEALRRLARMSETDLAAQSRLLEQSLAGMKPGRRRAVWPRMPYAPKPSEPVRRDEMVSLACRLADRVLDCAVPGEGEEIFLQHSPATGRACAVLSPVGWNLYDGLSGMAVFFAQAARCSGRARYQAAARAMLAGARRRIRRRRVDDIGAYSGLAGWCYVLCYLGALWQERALYREACRWLPEIERAVAGDRRLDLIGGTAGALWTCIRIHGLTGSEQALGVAARCAEHLLEHSVRTAHGLGWTTTAYSDKPVTGFGHGAAGPALGLAWLAELTGSLRYHACARQALAFEQATLDHATGTFADMRANRRTRQGRPGRVYAWCHGAPGMALARLCLPASFQDSDWRRGVNAALRTTLAEGFGAAHCLCHGDLGNLDLFLEAEKLRELEVSPASWRSLLPEMILRIRERPRCGSFREAELVDLMGGLSGIGYGLLRLAYPEQVPSVLTLDLPGKVILR